MANSSINIRIDSDVKAEAQALFSRLGMDMSTAVNIFIRQAIDFGGIPFAVCLHRYNAETEAAIREAEDIISGRAQVKRYNSFDKFIKDLDEEDDNE